MQSVETAKLSSKFQIVIPRGLREGKGWRAGQRFAFIPKGSGVLMVPVPERDALAGIARGASAQGYRDRSDRY